MPFTRFDSGSRCWRTSVCRELLAGLILLALAAPASAQQALGSVASNSSTSATLPPTHPLTPAIRLAQASLTVMEGVQDYECRFDKRERINGQLLSQSMFMRFRERPFSVYLKFDEPHAGREVLYVAGQNNGMMLAHEGSGVKSWVGTVPLALDSPQARAENRHPLTNSGMKNMLTLLIRQWEQETAYGEIDVQFYPDARIGNVSCQVVEALHPRPRRQFAHHITRIYLDPQTRLLVRLENYGWPEASGTQPPLMEEYTFRNVRVNVGLTDREFDQSHPEYKF